MKASPDCNREDLNSIHTHLSTLHAEIIGKDETYTSKLSIELQHEMANGPVDEHVINGQQGQEKFINGQVNIQALVAEESTTYIDVDANTVTEQAHGIDDKGQTEVTNNSTPMDCSNTERVPIDSQMENWKNFVNNIIDHSIESHALKEKEMIHTITEPSKDVTDVQYDPSETVIVINENTDMGSDEQTITIHVTSEGQILSDPVTDAAVKSITPAGAEMGQSNTTTDGIVSKKLKVAELMCRGMV